MLRSLYSGVSGLKNHQTKMDVIGNNIANVNTVGFKSSRVTFQDIYNQTVRPASAPSAGSGGVNPQQVGLGVSLGTIEVQHTRTATEYTGNALDLSVEGDGFLVVKDNGVPYYTRAGNLTTDANNNLVNANGLKLQGWMSGMVDTTGTINGSTTNPVTEAQFQAWLLTNPANADTLLADINIPVNYYDVNIGKTGEIIGINKTTSVKETIGRLVIADFNNQAALSKMGNNLYDQNQNTGAASFGFAGVNGTSYLNPNSLEMSNVDLAKEFTDMITTQRGFQANSRIITTSDQLLEELVNLKR